MIATVDRTLNKITMYRLVLYCLIGLVVLAAGFSFLKILPYSGVYILFEAAFLVAVGWLTNTLFARVFKAPTNVESVYISALILTLIITPVDTWRNLAFLVWAAVWTMASKFIFAISKKHLFNPVAFAVFLTSVTIGSSASWWVGNLPILPAVAVFGLLIIRKIQKGKMIAAFATSSLITIFVLAVFKGSNLLTIFKETFFYSPWAFFAGVMLTEPLTTPPTQNLQIIYGALVGVLFSPQVHIGSLYTTPEIALLIGNLFSYLVSPKEKYLLTLVDKIRIGPNLYDFLFAREKLFKFAPGQYLEWTLAHDRPDARGNRRFFTVASSPTEHDLRVGVKFYDNSSSFKKKMLAMQPGDEMMAGQLAGDFVLPKDPDKKLVFIAGGIGITPFRSMLKYLIDTNQRRDIVLFYSNKTAPAIIYKDVFDAAEKKLGIKVVYTLTDSTKMPEEWPGMVGRFNEQTIMAQVPDWRERTFYVSGTQNLVDGMKETLKRLGLPKKQIVSDFFPGF